MQLLGLVHLLLNAAGLLLWLRWREETLQSSRPAARGTLLGTLRKATTAPAYRWAWLGFLVGLVFLRGLGYRQMGSALRWTPSIDLGVGIVISLRSDLWGRMLCYSLVSQLIFIGQFYCWLLLLSAVNRRVSDADPFQNRVRVHLGVVERCPAALKLLLPFLITASLWLGVGPALARSGFLVPAHSMNHTLQQAVVIGLDSFLAWKYLIAGVLLLHLLSCYVYLGRAPFWNFINVTGQNLLRPISWLPLRLGRIDLAPLAGAALVLFAAEMVNRSLPILYQRLPLR